MTVLYYFYLLPLFLSFLSSLSSFRLDWPKPFRWFCIFLLATLTTEIFAVLWKYQLHHTSWWNYSFNNLWIYNLYLLPQYLFYIYFFSSIVNLRFVKVLRFPMAFLLCSVAAVDLFWGRQLFLVNYFTIITANFIVIFFSVSYFVQLMRASGVIRLAREPAVWISIGAFIFHLGSLPCFILLNYLSSGNVVLSLSLFRIIIVLNTLMYTLYSIAFICTKKFPTQPSLPL